VQLGPKGGREGHVGEHVRRAYLVSDPAPLRCGGLGIVLGECRGS
jgi:hypothetical protein